MFRRLCLALSSMLFLGAGSLHFTNPEPFVSIVPPYLPAPGLLVAISGVAELAGGLGLLVPRLRRPSAWGLLALLVAVYPANIHMLVNDVYLPDMPRERWLLWARMPLQFVAAAVVAYGAGLWPRPASRSAARSASAPIAKPPTVSTT